MSSNKNSNSALNEKDTKCNCNFYLRKFSILAKFHIFKFKEELLT